MVSEIVENDILSKSSNDMSSYNELIALINGCINRNGVQAITGRVLNGVLRAMVNQLGAGYAMGGVAHPTDDPGTPEAPVCYYASEVGTYTHFGNIQIVPGELALLCFDLTDGWFKETMYEGFESVQATIDGNVGTPAVNVTYVNGVLSFDFSNMKGNTGAAAGFGNVTAAVDGTSGTPGVSVQTDGPDTAKNIAFQFTGLKGETGVTSVIATVDNTSGTPQCAVSLNGQQLTLAFTGLKGAQGDTGSSVAYPFTIVNNLTTNDATQALSAAMGVQLESEVSQLEAKVTGLDTDVSKTAKAVRGVDDLSISDEVGNILAKLTDGHIKTKNFDSENVYKKTDFDIVQSIGDSEEDIMSQKASTELFPHEESTHDDLLISDKEKNSVFRIKGGYPYTKNFDGRAILGKINEAIEEYNTIRQDVTDLKDTVYRLPIIYCVGDSLTEGQYGVNPLTLETVAGRYPAELQLLMPDYSVVNLGVGGQKASEVYARMGWENLMLVSPIVLYGDMSESVISTGDVSSDNINIVNTYNGGFANYLLRQGATGAREQQSTIYLNGIECSLRYDEDTHNLYVSRKSAVGYDVTIGGGTQIVFKGTQTGTKDDIFLVCAGANPENPNLTGTQAADFMKHALELCPSDKYLVFNYSLGDANQWRFDFSDELKKVFGSRFVDIHGYLCSYQSFQENGLTPTTDGDISAERASHGVISDVYAIANNRKPSTFWRNSYLGENPYVDSTHNNIIAYRMMAKLLYERMKFFNWVN